MMKAELWNKYMMFFDVPQKNVTKLKNDLIMRIIVITKIPSRLKGGWG